MSQPPVAPGQWHSRPSRPPQLQNLPYVAPSSVPHVPHQTEPLPAHFTGSGPSLNAFPPQYANAAAPPLPPLSHPAASPAHQLQPHPAHSSGNFSGSFSPSFSRHFQAFQAPFQTPFQTPSQTQTHFQTPYQTPFSAHLQGSGPRLGGYPAQFNPSDRVTSSGVPQAPYGFAQQTATQTLQPTQPHTYPFPNPGSFVPQADPYSTQPDQGALSYQYTQQNVQRRNQPARNRRPAVSRATASESRALGGTDDNEEPRRRRTATDIADEAIRRRRMAQTMVVASWRKMLENYCEPVSITSLPEDERACVICYNEFGKKTPEGFTERPVRLIKCKHVFGEHCILLWMKRRKTCPYCREDLGSVRNPSSTRAFIGIMTIGEAYTARLAEEMNQRDPRNPIHLARPSSAGYA